MSVYRSDERTLDLHAHTTASDGDQTPENLVYWAACLGLSAVAVTDHDTTDGVARSVEEGKKRGVEVVPGIELSAEFSGGQCHILGHLIDPAHPALLARLTWVREARASRNVRIVAKIQAHGFDVTMEEIEAKAGGDIVARPHFAQVLLEKGYVSSMAEAFDRYLGRGGLFYEDRVRLMPDEAISLIHGAGGVATLAHPNNMKRDPETTEAEILRLQAAGLDGIEARYNLHTPEDTARYLALAEKHGLLTTGGSDFHGPSVKPGVYLGHVEGHLPAPAALLDRLKSHARSRQ